MDTTYDLADALGMDLYLEAGLLTGGVKVSVAGTPITFDMTIVAGGDIAGKTSVTLSKVKGKLYLLSTAQVAGNDTSLKMTFLSADKLGCVPSKTMLTGAKTAKDALDRVSKGVVAQFKYSFSSQVWERVC